MRESTDIELVRAARGGSIDAAESLFERHWPLAWRAAYAVLGDRSLADDAAQRAAERALRSLDQFRGEGPFGPWLRRIAINQSVDMLRRDGREQPLPDDLLGADPYPEIIDRDAAIWEHVPVAVELRTAVR
jgi:RNA polymerase sigma-70 factor (ECF subfamily)